jgi:beta-galactosidase
MNLMQRKLFATIALSSLGMCSAARAQDGLVWIEAENTASSNLKVEPGGWGNKEFLSGEKWLNVNIDADKVAAQLPEGGGMLSYKFSTKAGKHEIWNRVGFEFVRSPFEWRVDGGEWNKSSPDDLTTDLMPIADWTEVAWLKLGERDLKAGEHTLDIRLTSTKNDKGEVQRILYASDAVVISPGEFRPDGPHKPGAYVPTAQDTAAAKKVFELPAAGAAGARSSVSLEGDWEIARDDEQMPKAIAVPLELPTRANWRAIAVPSDKNKSRVDLQLAHRLWYRTRVNVPADQVGRSFFINFPMNSLNTTVYVNRQQCGFNKNPFAPFQIDVSKAIKAGENEIMVGIRDAWYGRTFNPRKPMELRRAFNLPLSYFGQGFQQLDYPIWNNPNSGILEIPTFHSVGQVYTSDVFVKPSVARKQLNADITLSNPSNAAVSGEVAWAAIDDKTGEVAKTFAPKPFTVPAGGTQVLEASEAWANPKLWWPDTPNMYRLRTTVRVAGQPVDVSETSFGFREWSSQGIKYLLNGVDWPQWADLSPLSNTNNTVEEVAKDYHAKNQRTLRIMNPGQGAGQTRNWGLPQKQMFDYFDRHGVVVRRNGLLDGQTIGYAFQEGDADLKEQNGTEMKVALMDNYRDQYAQLIRAERNHPSINVWNFDNEFLYINLVLLLRDNPLMDQYERKFAEMQETWRKVDSTRFYMSGGGGALKSQVLDTHGNHYVFDPKDTRYPNLAYEMNPEAGSQKRWVWDMKRPRFMGEDFFATGINPADYAQWAGEGMFLSKDAARPGGNFVFDMLMQGYRWAGQGAWHFWVGTDIINNWNSMKPRAVFVREYDWTFGSGQKINRTFGIFNDTQYSEPITFTRTLMIGKKSAWTKTSEHKIGPGGEQKFAEVIPMPSVRTRTEGELVVSLKVGGQEVFRDSKPLSILATTVAAAAAPRASSRIETRSNAQVNPALASSVAVYDPSGKVAAFFKGRGTKFSALTSLAALPTNAKVLVIGPDALSEAESTSSALAAWASEGRTVLVLDQKHPLRFQALTAEISTLSNTATEATETNGNFAFPEDLGHPAMRELRERDFRGWGQNGQVYRNAYRKPARGARSLVQVGPRLEQSALIEVPTGRGLMLLSQLDLGSKLGTNAVAQQLMGNLLSYAASYKQEFRPVALVSGGEAQLTKAADAVGLQYSAAGDPIAAISDPKIKLAVIHASPANLQVLAGSAAKVNAFTARGGYIVFHGLTPEGLDSYNKLVGFDHMIRPMRRERVQFSAPRNPLTAGLTLGDVVMLSGEKIFGWVADEYVASDIFSHIVDYDDVAPFGVTDNGLFNNAVNGFVGSDGWKQINDFPAPMSGPFRLGFTLPRPQTITEFTWDASVNYNATTKVGLAVDGKEQSWPVPANGDAQTLAVRPALSGKSIELQIQDWEKRPDKRNAEGAYTIGIDNINLKAARSADFYQKVKPMLNVGGLMHYPRGNGGMVLMNILFKDAETVPINVQKKRTIFSTILRNLQAPFAGGKTIIAGAKVDYAPIDFGGFPQKLTQYRTERGWFGDNNFTFNALPRGEQRFAGVTYSIFDFPTSPVPTAIMLGGNGVPNNPPQEVKDIPIGRKADALFFLHTARMDNRRNNDEIRDNKQFEMARYTINYANGQSVQLPIYAEIDIDSYRQEAPRALPGAQIAWTAPFANSKEVAVAYSKQWNNPRPDVAIKSIDFTYGPDDQKRGVPVLLAITAATAGK